MLKSVSCLIDKLSLPYSLKGIRSLYKSGNIGFDSVFKLISNKKDFSSFVVYSHILDNWYTQFVISF